MSELAAIRTFLQKNSGVSFTELGIQDESEGKWVKDDQVLNRYLARFIKVKVAPNASTGDIGDYLYHQCEDLLEHCGFWTTKKGKTAFWYSWKATGNKKSRDNNPLEDLLDCPYLVSLDYVRKIAEQLKRYKGEWGEVVVLFGIKGEMRTPNYQIESLDGEHVQPFWGTGHEKNDKVKRYKKEHLSPSFSFDEYMAFAQTHDHGVRV